MKKQVAIQAYTSKRYEIPKRIRDGLNTGTYTPYIVAQEGTSKPFSLAKGGTVALNWSKNLIQRIASKFNGIKFFRGHGKGTNSHAGRTEVGRAAKVYVDEIDGKTSIVSLVPGELDEDICSMEAFIEYDNGQVTDVRDITAVAIASSRDETPAFPGAVSLGQIQCFNEEIVNMKHRSLSFIQCFENGDGAGGGSSQSDFDKLLHGSFEEIKSTIRRRDLWPREVFSVDRILEDRELAPKLKEKLMEGAVTAEEYKKLKDENDANLKELEKFRESERLGKTKDLLDEAIKKRKYSEKQKNAILLWKEEGFFDDVDPSDPASITQALEKGEKRYLSYKNSGLFEDDNAKGSDDEEDEDEGDESSINDIAEGMEI